MNKIITPEYTEYQINKQCKITLWKDRTFTITLKEDTIDLTPPEVKQLERIIGEYNLQKDIRKHDLKNGIYYRGYL